ncbi:MAG: SlyX protein [Phenylobacterium sp.]|jgi:SlyX protein
MSNDWEQRINELESKVAFQDDTIELLNNELNQHQESIQKLQNQIALLGSRFKEIKDGIELDQGSDEIVHELPPHY